MNGVEGIFRVYPVQMVNKKSKLKRENGRNGHHRRDSSDTSFNKFLEIAKEEAAPAECHTVTYTADRRLQTYSYHVSREYTF